MAVGRLFRLPKNTHIVNGKRRHGKKIKDNATKKHITAKKPRRKEAVKNADYKKSKSGFKQGNTNNLHGQSLLLPDACQLMLRVLHHCGVLEASCTAASRVLDQIQRNIVPIPTNQEIWMLQVLQARGLAEAQARRADPMPAVEHHCKADSTPQLGCCPECRHVRLEAPNHSNVEEKDRQRAHIDASMVAVAAAEHTTAVLNALVVDAPLCDRLFCDELAAAGRLRQDSDKGGGRWRVVAPNLDPAVVRALEGRRWPPSAVLLGEGCVCQTLRHYEPMLARSGGLSVLFLDVHGAFRNGAATMLRWCAERCLFGCTTERPAVVGFAVSLLDDQIHHGGRDAAVAWLRDIVATIFDRHTHYQASFPVSLGPHGDNLRAYSQTMVYCVLHIRRRPLSPRGVLVPGFNIEPLLIEQY